jgi:predicted nuclease with TOPRIM domain
MKIEKIHAHFLVNTDAYNNERVGFTVILDEDDDIKETVDQLRKKACNAIGENADILSSRRRKLSYECEKLQDKLDKLRQEWEATAEFLKAQGINTEAPSMPQFRNLLTSVEVNSEEVVTDEDEDNF